MLVLGRGSDHKLYTLYWSGPILCWELAKREWAFWQWTKGGVNDMCKFPRPLWSRPNRNMQQTYIITE